LHSARHFIKPGSGEGRDQRKANDGRNDHPDFAKPDQAPDKQESEHRIEQAEKAAHERARQKVGNPGL
jgi:hypothetical protein